MSLSRDDKMKMLTEDLERAIETGDIELHERTRAEFYNLTAQKAKAEGDKITLYLLSAIEECNRLQMSGASSLLNSLVLFHKLGLLNNLCGLYLSPTAAELTHELVHLARQARASKTQVD